MCFKSALKDRGFLQIVKTATHIEGGVLDHVYINTNEDEISWDIEKFPKYYSDHDGIGLTLWNGKPDKGKQIDFLIIFLTLLFQHKCFKQKIIDRKQMQEATT